MVAISRKFTCKCGERECFVGTDEETAPCPVCGRVYIGLLRKDKNNPAIIDVEEVDEGLAISRAKLDVINMLYDDDVVKTISEKLYNENTPYFEKEKLIFILDAAAKILCKKINKEWYNT